MDGLGERIKISAEGIGGLDALCARLSGTSRRTLSDWANDKTEPRASALVEICDITGCSISWLLSGDCSEDPGDGIDTGASPDRAAAPLDGVSCLEEPSDGHETAPRDGDYILLPFFDGRREAAADRESAAARGVDRIAFHRDFLHGLGADPVRCKLLWSKGDSMSPTIPDGSLLVVDLSQSEVHDGCLYVFEVEHDLLVKRARRRLDGAIELVCENHSWPSEIISEGLSEKLKVVGRVVYFGRKA